MQVKKRGFGIRGISFIKLELRRVADQLGLKSSRPPIQVDPGSTWPVVFSECSVTNMYMYINTVWVLHNLSG